MQLLPPKFAANSAQYNIYVIITIRGRGQASAILYTDSQLKTRCIKLTSPVKLVKKNQHQKSAKFQFSIRQLFTKNQYIITLNGQINFKTFKFKVQGNG